MEIKQTEISPIAPLLDAKSVVMQEFAQLVKLDSKRLQVVHV